MEGLLGSKTFGYIYIYMQRAGRFLGTKDQLAFSARNVCAVLNGPGDYQCHTRLVVGITVYLASNLHALSATQAQWMLYLSPQITLTPSSLEKDTTRPEGSTTHKSRSSYACAQSKVIVRGLPHSVLDPCRGNNVEWGGGGGGGNEAQGWTKYTIIVSNHRC